MVSAAAFAKARSHLLGTVFDRLNAELLRLIEAFVGVPRWLGLRVSHDTDEREYDDAADQIREVLIHGNYLSQRDIGICLGFDVESIADRSGIDAMPELHAALVEKYKVEDATTPG